MKSRKYDRILTKHKTLPYVTWISVANFGSMSCQNGKEFFGIQNFSDKDFLNEIGNLSVFDIFCLLYHLHNDIKNPCNIFITMSTLWKYLIRKTFVQTLLL